ncbi:MAG: hypothetical protein HQL71_15035 [Magnetococcales bacterium]|nr:hypothetical protein [Magnetococcales bacterium]
MTKFNKLKLVLIAIIISMSAQAFAGWVMYDQEKAGGKWKNAWKAKTKAKAISEVGGSCEVTLYSGNHSVKIVDEATGKETIFLCDEVNMEKKVKAQKRTKEDNKAKELKAKNDTERNKVKLW